MDNIDSLIPVDKEKPEQFKPEYKEIDLDEYVKHIFAEVDAEDIEEELRRHKKWQKNRAFYRGNQRGFWDAKKRTWVTVDLDSLSPSEASVLVINNQFRPQVKTLSKEFSRSQTRVRANAVSDSQRSVLTGRFADALIRYYQPKLMPESVRQLEAKYLLLCGNAFRYTYFKKEKKSAKVTVPKMGEIVRPEYKKSVCVDCGEEEMEGATECQSCQSTNIEHVSAPSQKYQGKVGEEVINAGDPETEVVDPVEIKVWAGAKCLEDSPFLRRRRFVKKDFIYNAFPFFTPSETSKLSDSAQSQWQFLDTSSPKDAANTLKGLYEFTQLWLDKTYYTRKKISKDVKYKKSVNGMWTEHTIPAGTKLDEYFPDGMYVCFIGGEVVAYYGENKGTCWLHTSYDINVDGFWGDGLEDSVMNQQIINEYTSLSVENVLYNASPKLVINPSLINPVAVTGRPKDMILMSDNARRESEPKNAFAQISGMQLTSEVAVGIETAKRDMREQTGALLGFNGQGDPNITTATGMSIARDSALALVSTPLAVRAETDEAWCWQIIRIVKEHWYDQKYKFLLGKYNESEADAFRECSLEEEINLFVEPNSWMPQTNFEKLQNLGAYLTAFGLPMGFLNPSIPQIVRDYASQLYNVPFDFDELAPDIRIAQRRLDKAKDLSESLIPVAMAGGEEFARAGNQEAAAALANNAAVAIANVLDIEEDIDEHLVFATEYKKWLKTDEGQLAHPIMRQGVKTAISNHMAAQRINEGLDAQHQAALNGGVPPEAPQTSANNWQQNAPAESPFQVKSQVEDHSENADKSNL